MYSFERVQTAYGSVERSLERNFERYVIAEETPWVVLTHGSEVTMRKKDCSSNAQSE